MHAKQNARDVEFRVEGFLHALNRVQQRGETLHRQKVRLQGNHHRVGSDEGIERQHAERRRAVDQDIVVGESAGGVEPVAKLELPAFDVGQLAFGGGEIDRRGEHAEIFRDHRRRFGDGTLAGEHIVDGRHLAIGLDAIVQREVALRIEVNETQVKTFGGNGGTEVRHGRGLAHASLLIDNGNGFHGAHYSELNPGDQSAKHRRPIVSCKTIGRLRFLPSPSGHPVVEHNG